MKVYVFGNQDDPKDKVAIEVAKQLQEILKQVQDDGRELKQAQDDRLSTIEFVVVKPNEDLPFVGQDKVVIMDVVAGLKEVRLIEDAELDHIQLGPRVTAHDFDLGWQIKYLKKLGKLGKVKVIGLPMQNTLSIEKIKQIIQNLL